MTFFWREERKEEKNAWKKARKKIIIINDESW